VLRPNQFYVGTSVDQERNEAHSDYLFEKCLSKFVAEIDKGRPLVYCGLGTAAWRYKGSVSFLRRLICSARNRRWNLIIASGTLARDCREHGMPNNVAVFETVPQIRVLEYASVMISHGGVNSIAECLYMGVPIMVYPGTREIDQAGNAARVVYHKLGLKGDMSKERIGAIAEKVERIIGDREYLRNAERFRKYMEEERITSSHAAKILAAAFGQICIPDMMKKNGAILDRGASTENLHVQQRT
jgi:UDP:flavonoid glycosyltransferase YjiC (YdhE family)